MYIYAFVQIIRRLQITAQRSMMVKKFSIFFNSIACLAALQRHGECLALVNKRLEIEKDNADLFLMRARIHNAFRNVSFLLSAISIRISYNVA